MDPTHPVNPDPRRKLPSVDRLSRQVRDSYPDLPEWAATAASRGVVAEMRERISQPAGGVVEPDPDPIERSAAAARRLAAPHPRRVINATGVVLHTNLGRAPLASGAAEAARDAALGYSSLELDLETGRRGQRLSALARKLCSLSGAEAALAVNNNAAAVLLALDSVARGKEVVVSRGELVEIGGSFRVPAIMERAGVRLIEVGTTNRTHPRDYEEAIGSETALLLKVHRSNFEQRGFVAEVELPALAEIGRAHGLPVIEDLGAGTFVDLRDRGFPADSFAPGRLALGADLVCFSGDKLLGGPQAGIALGSRALVDGMASNPLARALRLDKLSLAALDWTVGAMLRGAACDEIPLLRALLEAPEQIEERARRLCGRMEKRVVAPVRVRVEADRVPVGGGSLPGFELESWAVVIRSGEGGPSPLRIAERLRAATIPVLARLRDDAVLVDLRTVAEEELDDVAAAFARALR
ncbi:MAG: L-seryl-tRNA(Sec) selenium transferase [Deltaproteobacteria bacterium]|nr:L-seryl-tRNA(Sec) selenium transferase [Deltaproteobacteria bacterium]MBW2417126.1 L-seryl-tRNA(Sec) selenium transferase [Deltaproteobacteria bacterium]